MFRPSQGSLVVVTVENVSVRCRGKSVEFDVAVSAGGLGIVRRARGIHQRTLGELGDIGQVLAGIGQALDGLRFDRRGGVGIFKSQQRLLSGDFDSLRSGGDCEIEVQCSSSAHFDGDGLRSLLRKARSAHRDGVCPRIDLREDKPPIVVGLLGASGLGVDFNGGDSGAGQCGA